MVTSALLSSSLINQSPIELNYKIGSNEFWERKRKINSIDNSWKFAEKFHIF